MREYVVKVECGESRGTGFLIGPGLVATALHVVAELRGDATPTHARFSTIEFVRLRDGERTWERRRTQATLKSGSWNVDEDWALLEFDVNDMAGWDLRPAGLARLRAEDIEGRRVAWSSWGFPEANPNLGMDTGGHVRTLAASLDAIIGPHPIVAIQLYSDEAAAADGMPLRGLSGAPVLVEGNVVGLLRWALFQPLPLGEEPRSQAGTLYATPIGQVDDPLGVFRWEDSELLPALDPSERLPEEPFRFLERYGAEDYRIFFGRSPDIRQFLSDLRRRDLPAVGLLYGPMGAGKSSFLRAGIAARLKPRDLYIEARSREGLLQSWTTLRQRALSADGLLVVDQLEETWTIGGGDNEFAALLEHITDWLESAPPQGGVRVFLSFRQDQLSSVEEALRKHGMRWHPFPLRHLDSHGLLETMTGFGQNPTIRDTYGIRFAPQRLPQDIVNAVLVGNSDAVAPVLQVLLNRLWIRAKDRAVHEGTRTRTILDTDFELERAAAAGLQDFLHKQLVPVEMSCPKSVLQGLALEILSEYTTPGGTAAARTTTELVARYPADSIVPIPTLVLELAANKLLFRDRHDSFRLIHDSLAPVVQYAISTSDRLAQRARRILEGKTVGRADGGASEPLQDSQLAAVEAAKRVMRRRTTSEQLLIEVSRQSQARRARVRFWLRCLATAAVTAIVVLGLFVRRASIRRVQAQRVSAQGLAANWFLNGNSALENNDDVLTAFLAVSQAISVAPEDDPRRPDYLLRLLALVPSAPELVMSLGFTSKAALSPRDNVAVLLRHDGRIEAWDVSAKTPFPSVPQAMARDRTRHQTPPVVREDGRFAGVVIQSQEPRLVVWEVTTGRVVIDQAPAAVFPPTFGPDGWVAQGRRLWNIETSIGRPPLDLEQSVWLTPSSSTHAIAAVASQGLKILDLARPDPSARVFLRGMIIPWARWRNDGNLLAVARDGANLASYLCNLEGCAEFTSDSLSNLPVGSLLVDRSGLVFTKTETMRAWGLDGLQIDLPKWSSRLVRLHKAEESLVGVLAEGSIVECGLIDNRCRAREQHNRRIPDGAVAVEWTDDGRHLLTLSRRGHLLSWPTPVRALPPTNLAPLQETTANHNAITAIDARGELAALGRADKFGTTVHIRSLSSGTSVAFRIPFQSTRNGSTVASSSSGPGELRVLRFSEGQAQLLVGFDIAETSLRIVSVADGSSTELVANPGAANLVDAILLDKSALVLRDTGAVEQMPLPGTSGEFRSCTIEADVRAFGRHGELLVTSDNTLEVWTVRACRAFASVSSTASDTETQELVLRLLGQADEILGSNGKILARLAGTEVEIGQDDDGMLAASLGRTRLRMPDPTDYRGRYEVLSVSPDLLRVLLIDHQPQQAPDIGIWDLRTGTRIDIPRWIDATDGIGSAGFTANGERIAVLSDNGRLVEVTVGPTHLRSADWIKNIDIGVTGFRIRDGSFYSPPDVWEQRGRFLQQLESARIGGDKAAAALVEALERRR